MLEIITEENLGVGEEKRRGKECMVLDNEWLYTSFPVLGQRNLVAVMGRVRGWDEGEWPYIEFW